MADITKIDRPLNRQSVREAHERIKPYIHQTPITQCSTIDDLACSPQTLERIRADAVEAEEIRIKDDTAVHNNGANGAAGEEMRPARPNLRFFFKCENKQKIGAFKARGAFHALSRLTDGELEGGVVTHSSGNHAQALSLAATTRGIPAHIIMPRTSQPSKIAAVESYIPHGVRLYFSGPTEPEREEVMKQVREGTGARFVPPYNHPDIMLGQGTVALEFEGQVKEILKEERDAEKEMEGFGWGARWVRWDRLEKQNGAANGHDVEPQRRQRPSSEGLDAVIAPVGGGGLLSGIATALSGTPTHIFGAEPMHSGADDISRGLAQSPPMRITHVSTKTIADGLRTPVGELPWSVISDKSQVRGVYTVTEEQIKRAMRLLIEFAKEVIEPSAAVPLAVALYNEEWRRLCEREAGGEGWNVGIVLSGGNTTVKAINELFACDY